MKRILTYLVFVAASLCAAQAEPRAIGERLELLVDDHLIEKIEGDARLKPQRPEPREVALVTGEPWEGNTCAYYTIFPDERDGKPLFRMYYRGSHWLTDSKKAAHPEVACYAESRDGIRWEKPELGLFEFNGSKANNIVWDGVGTHNFTVFKDSNPECAPDARYKAIGRGRSLRPGDKSSKHGLFVFKSPDGIRWRLYREEPVITKGAFDSQNLAFWDAHEGRYREYHRFFNSKRKRDIMTCVSDDFVNWSEPEAIGYGDAPDEHLYTNAIQPYDRAPHILIGFPTRYQPKGSRVAPLLMTSRDRKNFKRWEAPVIPETAPKDRGGNRSNYMTWGMLRLPGRPGEISVYATEAYYEGPDSRVRRFVYRNDGFVALSAGPEGAVVTTRPLPVAVGASGDLSLRLNCRIGKNGWLRVGILDGGKGGISRLGAPDVVTAVDASGGRTLVWRNAVGAVGASVRLRIELGDADLFSLGR